MCFKKAGKNSCIESVSEVITTNDGGLVIYRPGTSVFMVDGKRYSFDDITAFNESVIVAEQYLLRTSKHIFLHIYTQLATFVMNLSQRHDAGFDTAVALRNAVVTHREKWFQNALTNDQTVDFSILNSDFTIRVQSGEEMQLFDTEDEVSETIQRISLTNRWFDVKTSSREFRFQAVDVCDLAVLYNFPDFIEKYNASEHRDNRMYWLSSFFLYAALLNTLLGLYNPPKNIIMLLFMAVNLWAIFHIYQQIAQFLLRPLMNRLNNWIEKDGN